MDDSCQILIPDSFLDLHRPAPGGRLRSPKATIVERHDHCEDLAQMLVSRAQRQADRGLAPEDVLGRVAAGLADGAGGLDAAEARWVLRRLAELLGWPDPGPA